MLITKTATCDVRVCHFVKKHEKKPNQEYSRNVLRWRSPFGTVKPLVVGVALKGVRALAVSAKGFGGVGPIFRVDNTIDGSSGNTQAGPGKVCRTIPAGSKCPCSFYPYSASVKSFGTRLTGLCVVADCWSTGLCVCISYVRM